MKGKPIKFNISTISVPAFIIGAVVFDFAYFLYTGLFYWFMRWENIVGWLFCIAMEVASVGAIAFVTYGVAHSVLVVDTNDYAGVWIQRHQALKKRITIPITIVMGAYFAVLPFIWESLSNIIWPLRNKVPGLIFLFLRLVFPMIPVLIVILVEWVLFHGKSKALHDKSDDLKRRRAAAKQRLWEMAVRNYGVPDAYLKIKNGEYMKWNIPAFIADQSDGGSRMYYYSPDHAKLMYTATGTRMVKNSERIAAIESVLQSLNLANVNQSYIDELLLGRQSYIDSETGCGKYLEYIMGDMDTGIEEDIFAFSQKVEYYNGQYLNGSGQSDEFFKWFYGSDIRALAEFCSQRVREMDSLFLERMNYYLKEYKIIKSGLDGEAAVQKALDMHDGSFFVMYGLRLEFPKSGGGVSSVETDALVFSPTGVFAIEIKNYGASGQFKIVVDASGNWYKEYPARGKGKPKKEQMANPFEQNDRHVSYLNRLINDTLGRDMEHRINVQNIIVLANDNVELDSDPGAKQTLTRVGNLYNHISQNQQNILTMEELEKIKSVLEARALPEKEYALMDYGEELKRLIASAVALKKNLNDAGKQLQICLNEHQELIADFYE